MGTLLVITCDFFTRIWNHETLTTYFVLSAVRIFRGHTTSVYWYTACCGIPEPPGGTTGQYHLLLQHSTRESITNATLGVKFTPSLPHARRWVSNAREIFKFSFFLHCLLLGTVTGMWETVSSWCDFTGIIRGRHEAYTAESLCQKVSRLLSGAPGGATIPVLPWLHHTSTTQQFVLYNSKRYPSPSE